MLNNLGLFLSKRAFLTPDLDGYVEGDGSFRLSYRELNASSNRIANAFVAAGIKKEERVGLLVMNSREFMEAYFALAKIGARVYYPAPRYCTDNGAMIAFAGCQRLLAGERDAGDAHVRARWPMEELSAPGAQHG